MSKSNAQKLRERRFLKSCRHVWVVTNFGGGVRGLGYTRQDAVREALNESGEAAFPDYYEVRQMTLVEGWK